MMEKIVIDKAQEVVAPNLEDNKDLTALALQYFDSIISPSGSLDSAVFPELDPFRSPALWPDQVPYFHKWNTETDDSSTFSASMSSVSDPGSAVETIGSKVSAVTTGARDDECKDRMKFPVDGDGGEDAPPEDESSIEGLNCSWKKKMRCSKKKYSQHIVKRRTDLETVEDGFKWRKYGQKPVKSSPYPRSYYRCTTAHCPVRKQVSRCVEDRGVVIASYTGEHNHQMINQQAYSSESSHFNNAVEALLDSFNQNNNRQAAPPGFSRPNLDPSNNRLPYPDTFRSLMLQRWPFFDPHPIQPSSVQDSMNMMMVYQMLKMKQELQTRTQEFMNFATQRTALSDLLGMNVPNNHPEVYPQSRPEPGLSVVDLMRLAGRTQWGQFGQKPSQPEPSNNSPCRRASFLRTNAPIPDLSAVESKRQCVRSTNGSDL